MLAAVLLLVSVARGEDLAWMCLPYETPADWHPYEDATVGDGLWGELEAIARSVIDGELWVDCSADHPTLEPGSMCAVGTTAAGDRVNAASLTAYCYPDDLGNWVCAPRSTWYRIDRASAGAEWTQLYIAAEEASGTASYTAGWTGVVSPDYPPDQRIEWWKASYLDHQGYWGDRGWSDGTCAWSWGIAGDSGYEYVGQDVSVNGTSLRLNSVDGVTDCMVGPWVVWLDGIPLGSADAEWNLYPDRDGDLAADQWDCAPEDPAFNFCGNDIVCDGLDHDCDGSDETDRDRDGVNPVCAGGLDCDDEDGFVKPGADETAGDGIDQDCDGTDDVDADGDGFTADGDNRDPDCDDTNPRINPAAPEHWEDGIDQNCNGTDAVHHDFSEAGGPPVVAEPATCGAGTGRTAWAANIVGTMLYGLRRRKSSCS